MWIFIQAALAAICAFLGWFLGARDSFLYALIAFVILDYITGVICAIIDKDLSSEIGARGIFKLYECSYNFAYANPTFIRMISLGSA